MKNILSGHSRNKGVTLITLIIAITIFAVFITVFSYVMIAKHGSEALYVQSTQAYAVAQAGIEYGIRYATDNKSNFFANPAYVFPGTAQSFGAGSFTLNYIDITDPDNPNTLKSTGKIGIAEREIILQDFTGWVTGGAITPVPGVPPSSGSGPSSKIINIPLMNNYDYDLYIYKIWLAKEGGNSARLNKFTMDTPPPEWAWTGPPGNAPVVSSDHNSPTEFIFNQVYIMAPGMLLNNSITVQATSEVRGTWYLTFGYSKQTDLSDPQSSLVTFYIP